MRYRVIEKKQGEAGFSLYVENGKQDWDTKAEGNKAARSALAQVDTVEVRLMRGDKCVTWWSTHEHTHEAGIVAEAT